MGAGYSSVKWIWCPIRELIAERKANLVLVARRTEPMETLAEELRQSVAEDCSFGINVKPARRRSDLFVKR